MTSTDRHERGGTPDPEGADEAGTAPRVVVLHYHLFKNAGTSLDAAFEDVLGEGEWATREFAGAPEPRLREVAAWIAEQPAVRCFSSHTALLPTPSVDGVSVVPVIFLRHPLDRIASAHAFESRQGASSFGSVLARNTTLTGYIETRLSIPTDHQCRNFHARRLADAYPGAEADLEARALRAFDELPFIGSVENYGASLGLLAEVLGEAGFGEIELVNRERNASRGRARTLERKLEEMRGALGPTLFGELERENGIDLMLYERLRRRFESLAADAA